MFLLSIPTNRLYSHHKEFFLAWKIMINEESCEETKNLKILALAVLQYLNWFYHGWFRGVGWSFKSRQNPNSGQKMHLCIS